MQTGFKQPISMCLSPKIGQTYKAKKGKNIIFDTHHFIPFSGSTHTEKQTRVVSEF